MSPSHAAFPTARARDLNSDELPNTPQGIEQLNLALRASQPEVLINALFRIAEGENQLGRTASERRKHGEEMLGLCVKDVHGLGDEDLHANTATLIFLLSSRMEDKTNEDRKDLSNWINLGIRLCMVGDRRQFELCARRVGRFAWALLNVAEYIRAVEHILDPLFALIQKVHLAVFTAAHAVLLEAILLIGKQVHIAELLAQSPPSDFFWGRPSYRDVLTYYHHLGLIFSVQGEYERARDSFLSAVIVPTSAASAIQVSCAKRAILCEILLSGKVLEFPKYTSSSLSRILERHYEPYMKLAKAYQARDWAAVQKMQDQKIFRDDQNSGMLRRILISIVRVGIQDLSLIYTRITAGSLVEELQQPPQAVEDTLVVLETMIQSGVIQADIAPGPSAAESIITFHDPDEASNSAATFAQLMQIKAMSEHLERELSLASKRLGSSEGYLKRQIDANRIEGREPKGGRKGDDREMDLVDPGAPLLAPGKLRPSRMGGMVGGDVDDKGF